MCFFNYVFIKSHFFATSFISCQMHFGKFYFISCTMVVVLVKEVRIIVAMDDLCRDPSLGLMTKSRVYKSASRK